MTSGRSGVRKPNSRAAAQRSGRTADEILEEIRRLRAETYSLYQELLEQAREEYGIRNGEAA